jgi:hypothetical protein
VYINLVLRPSRWQIDALPENKSNIILCNASGFDQPLCDMPNFRELSRVRPLAFPINLILQYEYMEISRRERCVNVEARGAARPFH